MSTSTWTFGCLRVSRARSGSGSGSGRYHFKNVLALLHCSSHGVTVTLIQWLKLLSLAVHHMRIHFHYVHRQIILYCKVLKMFKSIVVLVLLVLSFVNAYHISTHTRRISSLNTFAGGLDGNQGPELKNFDPLKLSERSPGKCVKYIIYLKLHKFCIYF